MLAELKKDPLRLAAPNAEKPKSGILSNIASILRRTDSIVETSWLPSVPQVTKALRPLGFRRRRDGAYRVVLSSEDASDDLRVVRLATKALGVLMAEGYF